MTLPVGFRVRLSRDVRPLDHEHVLVGGSPLTALRLSAKARQYLHDGEVVVTDATSAAIADRLLATNVAQPDLASQLRPFANDLTVVIPVRDRPEQLDRALAGLAPLWCLVIDDASRDAEAVAAVAARHGAEVLALPTNLGPAAARNVGLRRVRTPFVAFVDSDVTTTADDLLTLSAHFADPAVVLVGPLVRGISRSVNPRWFERYDEVASSLTLGRTPGVVRPGATVAWLPSACLVGRVEALGDGFEETMRVGEDVDLVWRLVDSGHRVRYAPEVTVHHDARPTMADWLKRKAVYGSSGAALAQRHGNKVAPAILAPVYAAAAATLLHRTKWAAPAAFVALTWGTRSVRGSLPAVETKNSLAAGLAARGLVWAVRQESALILRHWWPGTALAATCNKAARRVIATSLAVDVGVGIYEHRHRDDRIGILTMCAGRRLDDLAYGAGLWWGAARAHSLRVMLPTTPH